MVVTIEKLEEMRACRDGKAWFAENYASGIDAKELCRKLSVDKFQWSNWFISRALDNKTRYAIFAAEQVMAN